MLKHSCKRVSLSVRLRVLSIFVVRAQVAQGQEGLKISRRVYAQIRERKKELREYEGRVFSIMTEIDEDVESLLERLSTGDGAVENRDEHKVRR